MTVQTMLNGEWLHLAHDDPRLVAVEVQRHVCLLRAMRIVAARRAHLATLTQPLRGEVEKAFWADWEARR